MHSVQPGVGATAAAFPECIVDTGAHLTAIPERIWSYFKPGVITPLPFDPAMPQSLRVIAFGGGTYPYELGELRLRLRDLIGRAMDVTAVVQLIHDNGNLKISMVLGPRGGVLDNLSLRRYPDSTAPFGEAWILEDP